MTSAGPRIEYKLAILGFVLSNLIGGGVSYCFSRRLLVAQEETARRASERVAAQAGIHEVGVSFAEREYAFGDVIRAVAARANPKVVEAFTTQFDTLTRHHRGTTDLLGAELCQYFGPSFRDRYVRHLLRFGAFVQYLGAPGSDTAAYRERAIALTDSFPSAHEEAQDIVAALTEEARADAVHPTTPDTSCSHYFSAQ